MKWSSSPESDERSRQAPVSAWFGMLAILLVVGCGSGGSRGTGPDVPSAESRLAEGWLRFEAGDLRGAESAFLEAESIDPRLAPAALGLGWTHLRRGSLTSAAAALDRAAALGLDDVDLHAARALVARDLEPVRWEQALEAADRVLRVAPEYRFVHDPAVDWRDLRIVAAHAAFALGAYARVSIEIVALGSVPPDPSSSRYVEELLRVLETVSRS